ncbi:exopolygalacturonase-like [Gossypium australe]|uniref:Exopolygalacturonase-like n=1 Tax=Gossypium australe TaxID=47621 RepID=A0A5B6UD64_9ROSI|nr:exopolygalacturonase-like [Gossypium australe]
MALVTKARISLVILLCLVDRNGCERTGPFNPAEALVKAKNAAAGKLGPENFIRTFKAACNFRGNAMMVIPKGEFLIGPIIFQGPCFNPSSLIIQANGIVKAQADLSYFTGGADDTDWITFQSINGLILSGTGTFHGQGAKAWKYNDCAHKSHCVRLAANFKFNKVNDAIINGINSIDPKGFHIMVTVCRNFRLLNLKLQAPGDSPNTDGIHISKSNVVKIAHCVIGTGDDCVSMIHGVGSLGHYDDEADVSKIVVTNSSLTDTTNGVRIKTYKTDSPSKASSIFFTDLIMNRVKNPIIIDQEYGNRRSTQVTKTYSPNLTNTNFPFRKLKFSAFWFRFFVAYYTKKKKTSKVSISDVRFVNIKGTSISKVAVQFLCSKSNPCEGIQMNNINLQYVGPPRDQQPFESNCTNAKVSYVGLQNPPPCR